MRPQGEYIVSGDEVHAYAFDRLERALRLRYRGTKCTGSTLIELLLIAAARVVSIYAACRELTAAPCDQTIRDALAKSLPSIGQLQRRLNVALCSDLPKTLCRRRRVLAIDLTLIPYHGRPHQSEREIYRAPARCGTTHFHAYATIIVLHKAHRYTLGLIHVQHGQSIKEVVQQLLAIARRRGVAVRYLLLDKGFFNAEVLSYLKRSGHGFIVPAVPRGRKPKPGKRYSGLRALLLKKHGYYTHTLTGQRHSVKLLIAVASKTFRHKKTNKRHHKKLLYAVSQVRRTPPQIRELYRQRFGIETSYRQMNQARIRTCTRDPKLRLLMVGIALVLRNVWVWLHSRLAKGKRLAEPTVFLKLMRFGQMLQWIETVVQQLLGGGGPSGIKRQDYERLKAAVT